MTNKPTDQGKTGKNSPPKERQFGQPNGNPRNPGGWKKEDTPRYKLEQMMKLSDVELTGVIDDSTTPLFEVKLAKAIKEGNWREIESMINQVYGQPKQHVDGEQKIIIETRKRSAN